MATWHIRSQNYLYCPPFCHLLMCFASVPFQKVLFLKLGRILVLFLILGRNFLTGENHFSVPSRSFYSQVMPDGTLCGVRSTAIVELTRILFLAWKKYACMFSKIYANRRISPSLKRDTCSSCS